MRRLATIGILVLMLGLVAAPGAMAARSPVSGYTGVWQAIQCAQWESDGPLDVQCDVWGDGSTLRLVVGPGESPRILYTDTYSTYCAVDLGSPSTHWVAHGVGTYADDGALWADFTRGGCGRFDIGPYTMGFWWDEGSDTLWDDPDGDGWGLHWWRVGG